MLGDRPRYGEDAPPPPFYGEEEDAPPPPFHGKNPNTGDFALLEFKGSISNPSGFCLAGISTARISFPQLRFLAIRFRSFLRKIEACSSVSRTGLCRIDVVGVCLFFFSFSSD